MTIIEQMKKENSTIIEKKLTDKYYLFIEGLNEYSETTDNINNIENVLVELCKKVENYGEYVETLDNLCYITIDTELESLTFEAIQKHVKGVELNV